jgi:hypothetical protein
MLAPTVQAKHRWVEALQHATTRRISVQRKPSSFAVGNTLLLALDRPQNLSVTCTQIFDSDWLLLGTQEGLFVTTLKNPCQPFIVAGLSSIYLMELIVEYDMLYVLSTI